MNYKLDVELSEKLEPYRSAIEATIQPYIKIELTDNNSPTWWQSKFGGLPYMPKDFEYPKSNDGEYLYLLAQINFAEVPKLEGLPDKGILQFYLGIDKDFLYGCDFDNPIKQDKFRVIYFPNIDLSEQKIVTDFSFIPPDTELYLPFEGCSEISFKTSYAPISVGDYKFDMFKYQKDSEDSYQKYRQLRDEYYQKFEANENNLNKLLGYPHFTQEDPRYDLSKNEQYILLLQINTCGDGSGFSIQWGDVGIANFFIKRSHLEKLDFTEVLYNYDCH